MKNIRRVAAKAYGGAVSSLVSFVSGSTDISKITAMDVPPPPADFMRLIADGRLIEIPLDEIRKIVPEGCGICPDMTVEFSDISVGVLENN